MAIGKFLAPLNGQMIVPQNKPYVDDIFDPLFNAEVTEYYRNLYGPVGGIGAGYAAMLENALTGRKGILGPGMGILSTFGRSMDKADDFILGGLTEGVNTLGQVTRGNNEAPQNPFHRIFVDDYNYEGTKLMAAMGNAMAKLTGTQTPLDESDFQSMGDKIAGTTIDLATDPGIMGGQLARLNKGTAVGKAGEILSDYDDIVANVAGNMAFPGGKALVGKGLTRIRDFLGANSSAAPMDNVIKHGNDSLIFNTSTGDVSTSSLDPETLVNLRSMTEDIKDAAALDPITTPNEYALYEDIINKTNTLDIDEKTYQKAMDEYNQQQVNIYKFRNDNKWDLEQKIKDYRSKVQDQAWKGVENNPTWFNLKYANGEDLNYLDEFEIPNEYISDYVENNLSSKELNILKEYGGIQELPEGSLKDKVTKLTRYAKEEYLDYYITKDEILDKASDLFSDKYSVTENAPYGKDVAYLKKLIDEDDLVQAKQQFKNLAYEKHKKYSSPFSITEPETFENSLVGKEKLNLINLHLSEFLAKHPEGFNLGYLKNNIDESIFIPTATLKGGKISKSNPRIDFLEQIRQFTRGYSFKDKNYEAISDTNKFSSGNLTKLLSFLKNERIDISDEIEGTIEASGLIPWISKNAETLQKTQYGRDLISLGAKLNEDIFETSSKLNYSEGFDLATSDSISKIINPIFDSKWLNTKEAVEKFAKDFPSFELKLNPKFKGTEYETLLKHYDEYRRANKLYGTQYTTFNPINISEKATKILKAPSKADFTKISNELATFTPGDFSKTITSNMSIQDDSALNVFEDTFRQFKAEWGLPDGMGPEELETYVKTFGSRDEKTFFQLWNAATSSKVKNKLQMDHGALHVKVVQESKSLVDKVKAMFKGNEEHLDKRVSEYISKKDMAEGAMIHGDSFLEDLWAAGGFQEVPLLNTFNKAKQDAIAAAVKQNVDKVNKYGNILKFADVTEADGTRRLAVFFDTDNISIKKDLNGIYGLFGKKDLGLSDVTLRDSQIYNFDWDTKELDNVFGKIREGSEMLATRLGYKRFSPNYISHVMKDSEEATKMFNGIYESLGIDKNKLDKICQALQDQDIASGKLQFGAIPMGRAHLGAFGQYKGGFETDLSKIHTSTFTQGMLDNSNAQTYFDLFLTDNFKIKNNFDDVETLKKTLNLSEGNLNNVSIVKPRYNESGKLIGFSRYNKFSDASLAQAFADDEAILVPDAVIGSLDRMCKKDARMSSRVYRFINKYLTVPFKFGTLANPGFLAGNIQDAYFKQAVELSKKYGTTLEEELTNVGMAMRHVTQLNNNFTDIFEDYRAWLKNTDLKTITRSDKPAEWYNETFKYSKTNLDTLSIDRVCNDPKFHNAFREYINTHVPVEKRKLANFYLFLNNNQTTTMFNKDLEDLYNMTTNNPYNVPSNIVERIMYGDPSTKFAKDTTGKMVEIKRSGLSSYGLFLNNPVSNKILKTSNTIENWMRSSSIINDLQHQGYDIDKICNILDLDPVVEKATRAKFKMSMNEAINTMHAANFDYDNVSEFMNKASYILPFPTFYLKNLAFWADIFANKPQVIDNAISVHEGLWSGKDTSKDEFTAEAKGRGAIPIGQQGLKHLTGIVKQTPYNSMFGAFNAVNNFKEDFAYRTNPALRPIARHLQDPKDVKYRPYNTDVYQKNITKDNPEFSELAYMFHQLNPYERFVNTGLRTPKKISNNTYQLSDFLPSMVQPDFSKKSNKK